MPSTDQSVGRSVNDQTASSATRSPPGEVFVAVVGFGQSTPTAQADAQLLIEPPASYFAHSSAAGPYRLFDLYRGVELPMPHQQLDSSQSQTGLLNLTLSLEASMDSDNGKFGASGFGALLFTQHGADPALQDFLAEMRAMTKTPLGKYSCEGGPQCANSKAPWPFYETCNATHCAGLLQTMLPIAPTKAYAQPPPTHPNSSEAMVGVPGSAEPYLFVTDGMEWRGDAAHSTRGVGFQFPWEGQASRFHSHALNVSSLFVQK